MNTSAQTYWIGKLYSDFDVTEASYPIMDAFWINACDEMWNEKKNCKKLQKLLRRSVKCLSKGVNVGNNSKYLLLFANCFLFGYYYTNCGSVDGRLHKIDKNIFFFCCKTMNVFNWQFALKRVYNFHTSRASWRDSTEIDRMQITIISQWIYV